MKSTLERYVDLDNVPKKYGGNLEWNFGDMPFLEPEIANALRWKEDIREKGHRTFPIGPIKWQYDADGDLVATAIGTENGKPRNQVIAGLHPEAGVARLALSPGRQDKQSIFATVSGAAQATSTEAANGAPVAPPVYTETAANGEKEKPSAAVPDSSRRGTCTIPFRDNGAPSSQTQPSEGGEGVRQGTSETRYAQQEGTHAEGTLSEGTPHVKIDGHGEKQGIMEPMTVGQAPKEHPLPNTEADEGKGEQGLVGQVQVVAEEFVEKVVEVERTVLSAVGLGGGEKEKVEEGGKKEDPEIDGMDEKQIEEFLRGKSMSQPGR
jgi:hypothetical protein